MITTGAGLLIRENSWAHRLFPPCICIFLANTYCGSEIAASAVRTTATSPRPQYTKISGEEQAYISRPDEKRPESDRLIYDLGTGLPALTIANCFSQGWRFPSRLFFASFSARPARPPPQNFRNFPRSIGPRIRPKSNSLRIGNGRSWKGYLFEALWTLFSQNGGSSTEFYRSREPVVCERFNDCGIQRRMDILCEIIISICCDGLRYEK